MCILVAHTYVALRWLNTNHRIDAMCNVQSIKCEKTVQHELNSVGCTFTEFAILNLWSYVGNCIVHTYIHIH